MSKHRTLSLRPKPSSPSEARAAVECKCTGQGQTMTTCEVQASNSQSGCRPWGKHKARIPGGWVLGDRTLPAPARLSLALNFLQFFVVDQILCIVGSNPALPHWLRFLPAKPVEAAM